MAVNTNEQKNKSMIRVRPIVSLLVGLTLFTVILFVALIEAGKNGRAGIRPAPGRGADSESNNNPSSHSKPDKMATAIVLEIDKDNKVISLYDTANNEELRLRYTGGTSVLDKFGQVISISQVEIGLIVDVGYQTDSRLTDLKYSDKAWEYVGVNNMTINHEDNMIQIAKTKYTYTNPVVVDMDKFITLEDLAVQDELTVRGIGETIWSIIVTKGHGIVRIKDYEAFLGGSITVGYEAVQLITEDMSITVREGNYNLTVENGEYSGTKNVTIERNAETVVSVGDLGPEPVKYGKVTFEITPFGADLYIDKELTTYASPVELSYGSHTIEVSLGGYSTFRGNLEVDYASKKVQIVLPELQSKESVRVVETGDTGGESEDIEYNDWDSEQDKDDDVPEQIDSGMDDDYEEDPIVDTEHLIYIQNPLGVSVYLNGEYKGISPGSFQKVIGSHVVTFIKPGYQTKSYTIDIADDGLDTYISLPDLVPER